MLWRRHGQHSGSKCDKKVEGEVRLLLHYTVDGRTGFYLECAHGNILVHM